MRTTRHALRLLVGLGVAAVSVTLAACGTGGQGDSAVAAARSTAGRIASAASSAAVAASATDTAADTSASSSVDASGAGDTGSTTGTAGGPCALLSVQQASSINHVQYDSANSADQGDIGTCNYTKGVSDNLTVTTTDDAFCWMALTGDNGPGTPVAGVGDKAFGFPTGLDVQHGGTCIDIQGNTPAESSGDWGPDTAMAQIIIGRLG